MSAFLPDRGRGLDPARAYPELIDRQDTVDTVRRAWELRAGQWQARHLAEVVFGGPVRCTVMGSSDPLSGRGPWRGLLQLDVPFVDLDRHRELEAIFLAAVSRDPVLEQVPFIYLIGPAPAPAPVEP